MKLAIVGGDRRGACLGELLAGRGREVQVWGIEGGPGAAPAAESLEEALRGAGVVILPGPLGEGRLPGAGEVELSRLAREIPAGAAVLAGRPGEGFVRALRDRGAIVEDYLAREELLVRLADLTARGAVGLTADLAGGSVAGAPVLILGFGRIGRLLAPRLRDLGAAVTVAERSPAGRAWGECMGFSMEDIAGLETLLPGRRAVVNTVPALLLDSRRLRALDPGCPVLDLASRPGGVDWDQARRLGVRAEQALGIPGRTAPREAALALEKTVTLILQELKERENFPWND